jgi:hypothetical protein
MTQPSSFLSASRPRRLSLVLAASAALSVVLAGCDGEEGKTRKRIAGDYVREMDGGPVGKWHVRQVLSLRADGRWIKTTRMDVAGVPTDSPPDSGNYRIQGVMMALRSQVEPGGAPRRFTINGDSLFSANAAPVKALTGYDIGEEIFVRSR